MMNLCKSMKLGIFLAALLVAAPLPAQTFTRYEAQPPGSGTKVKIDGDSTVHKWTMEGSIIGGYLELDAAAQLDPAQAAPPGLKPGKIPARAVVSIPIRSIKSGKTKMDSVMQEAMKQPAHPKIEYRLTELSLKAAPRAAGAPFQFDSQGELSMSGRTNKISLPVTIDRVDKSKLKITGSIPLKMTSYGIVPPAPSILGVAPFKTDDNVAVSFEWVVGQAEAK
jgi:hypothetical protein